MVDESKVFGDTDVSADEARDRWLAPYRYMENVDNTERLVDRLEELADEDELSYEDRLEKQVLEKALEELASVDERDLHGGLTLVSDGSFREYAMDLAYDSGLVPDELLWPMRCIDWDQAARELQMDYTPIEVFGRTFWYQG